MIFTRGSNVRIVAAVGCSILACYLPGYAARKILDFDRVVYKTERNINSASFNTGSSSFVNKAGKAHLWGIIQGVFTSNAQWLDDVNVKVYALAQERGESYCLAGTAAFMSVPGGKNNTATFFVHPNVLMRYGKILAVHMEIWNQGKLIDNTDWPSKQTEQWWNKHQVVEGAVVVKYLTPYAGDTRFQDAPVKSS